MIPPFDEHGNLPSGLHEATWAEFTDRFGWTPRRLRLLTGLRAALVALSAAGCRRVYVGGSFVTTKEDPVDYDGCWDILEVDSTILDEVFVGPQSPMRQQTRYGGSLYPVNALADPDWAFMLEWFREDRGGNRKGIVVLDPRGIET